MRWYYDYSGTKKALPLRELPPASAWNEAMRRSIVISIAGFFVPNLLANFGAIPQLHQSFQFMPGICGAAGVFSASLALFVGYFHRKIAQGFAASIAGLVLPYGTTWFVFRVTHPSASAVLLQLLGPSALAAFVSYEALGRWHARLSGVGIEGLAAEVVGDEYGKPKARWERLTYGLFMAIGVISILFLVLAHFGRAR
jgi:hypothetical protein